jgi:hypothetical protein
MAIQPFALSRLPVAEVKEDLLGQLKDAQMEMEAAHNLFEHTAEALQVDQAILLSQAAEKRYSYLMGKIRSQDLQAQGFCRMRPWHKRYADHHILGG